MRALEPKNIQFKFAWGVSQSISISLIGTANLLDSSIGLTGDVKILILFVIFCFGLLELCFSRFKLARCFAGKRIQGLGLRLLSFNFLLSLTLILTQNAFFDKTFILYVGCYFIFFILSSRHYSDKVIQKYKVTQSEIDAWYS